MRALSTAELAGILRSFFVAGRFLRRPPHYSRDEMLSWQSQKITRLVRHAYDNEPFYHDLYAMAGFTPGYLQGWEDLHHLPTVSKSQVVATYPDRIVAKGHDIANLVTSRSSGSSGTPMDIAYDAEAMSICTLAGLRPYGMGFCYLPWHRQPYIYTSPDPLKSKFGLFPMTFFADAGRHSRHREVKDFPDTDGWGLRAREVVNGPGWEESLAHRIGSGPGR